MQLEVIMDGEGLESTGFGKVIKIAEADDGGDFVRGGGKVETFAQEEMVEGSEGYDLCMPVMQGGAIGLGDLIDGYAFYACAIISVD